MNSDGLWVNMETLMVNQWTWNSIENVNLES